VCVLHCRCCSLARAMDGRIVRSGITSSCQSAAATAEIIKRFRSQVLTYVRSVLYHYQVPKFLLYSFGENSSVPNEYLITGPDYESSVMKADSASTSSV